MSLLRVDNLSVSFHTRNGSHQAVKDVSFTVEPREITAIIGESGSGKSTLLHMIAGLDVPDAGSILVEAQNMAVPSDTKRAELRRSLVGIIFQPFKHHRSVFEHLRAVITPAIGRKVDPIGNASHYKFPRLNLQHQPPIR